MSARDKLSEPARESWQAKVIEGTRARQSRLGTILIAVLGYNRVEKFPRFADRAVISSDSMVFCDFWTRDGTIHYGAFVGSVSDLVGNLRGLADHCKLSDTERVELFEAVRKWIATDYRARLVGKVKGKYEL